MKYRFKKTCESVAGPTYTYFQLSVAILHQPHISYAKQKNH
jgi:hypothetical protein